MDRGDEKAVELLCFRATRSMRREVMARARAGRRSVSEWLRLRMERVLEAEPPPGDTPCPRGNRR